MLRRRLSIVPDSSNHHCFVMQLPFIAATSRQLGELHLLAVRSTKDELDRPLARMHA